MPGIMSEPVDVVLPPVVAGLVGGVMLPISGLVGGVMLPVVSGLVDVALLPIKVCLICSYVCLICLNAGGETEAQLKDSMLVGWQINVKLPLLLGTLMHGSFN